MDAIISTGTSGVQAGIQAAQRAAEQITRISTSTSGSQPDAAPLAQSLVELKQAEHQVQASVAVVQTADEVLGTLLDTRA